MSESSSDSPRPGVDASRAPRSPGDPEAPAGAGLAAGLRRLWKVPTYRFALNFLAYLVILSVCYPWLRRELGFVLVAAENGTARLIYTIFSAVGASTEISTVKPTVFFGGFPVTIIEECTGLYEALLLGAAMLAYPTSWQKTLLGFAIGYPLVYVLNVARIMMLLAVGRWYPPAFDFLHIYFWQVTMILMVVFVLYVWVRWVVRSEATGAPATP